MQAHPLPELPEVQLITLAPHGDARGFFVERWRADAAAAIGLPPFVQFNHSRSQHGTLRGLHYQAPPHAQGKLVGALRGRIFDVAVDLRRSSPSYGRSVGVVLDDERHQLLWVPPGFAHGFLVLSEVADVVYQVDAGYHPASEGGLRWDDPDLAIAWPLDALRLPDGPLTSARDLAWRAFRELESPFA